MTLEKTRLQSARIGGRDARTKLRLAEASASRCRRRMRGRTLEGWGWGAGGGGGGGEGSRRAETRYGARALGPAVLGGRVPKRASWPGAWVASRSGPCRGRAGPLGGGAAASSSRDSPRRRRGILGGPRGCSLSLASIRPSAGVPSCPGSRHCTSCLSPASETDGGFSLPGCSPHPLY